MDLTSLATLLLAACATIVLVSAVAVPKPDGASVCHPVPLTNASDVTRRVVVDRSAAIDRGVTIDQDNAADSVITPKTSLVREVIPRVDGGMRRHPWAVICPNETWTRKCMHDLKLVCDDGGQLVMPEGSSPNSFALYQCRDMCECFDLNNGRERQTDYIKPIDLLDWNDLNHNPYVKPGC